MKPHAWITRLAFIIVATASAAACASNTVAPDPTSPNPPDSRTTITSVTVSGAQAVSGSQAREIQSGDQLTASAQFSDGPDQDVTALASWASSNPAFATVSSTGMVTVVGTGEVELRATYQNVVGSIVAVVAAPEAPAIFVLSGIVRDSSTGQPLAGVAAQVLGDASGSMTTDQLGVYRLDGLSAGRILVEFTRNGYRLLEISVTMTGDRHRDVSLDPDVP